MMTIKKFDIWVADLEPRHGSETGKVRPVLIIQTDLLNKVHPSTLICPITTNVQLQSEILRIHIKKGIANVNEDCDIMIDQIRAIDNRRLIKKTGELPKNISERVNENIKIIFDLIE
jgi:mRNA interferase MazF